MFLRIIFLLFLSNEISATTLVRRSLEAYPLAVCNDGTPATYYIEERSDDPHQIFIWLKGGGGCYSSDDCRQRCEVSNPDLCTTSLDESMVQNALMWSTDPEENPAFYNHLKVYVPYCSSDVYSGVNNDSETGYFFHGRHIVSAILHDLEPKIRAADNKPQVVLSGGSAGGFGTGINCDFVADMVLDYNDHIDVRCIPDGGDFYPFWVSVEDCDIFELGAAAANYWGSVPDTTCIEATGDPARCLIFADYFPYVETPTMVVTSFTDINHQVHQCAPEYPEQPEFWDLWRQEMDALGHTFIEDPKNGIFLLNCPMHVLSQKDDVWGSVGIDVDGQEVVLRDAIATWVNGGKAEVIDSIEQLNPNCP